MTFKFYSSRVKELLLIFVGGSVALLICLTIISYEGFKLHAEFVCQSAVEPIKSMLWNHNSRILTPVTIAGMVSRFFVKNIYQSAIGTRFCDSILCSWSCCGSD